MDAWRHTLSQFRELFNGLAPTQRLTLAAAPLLLVAALGLAWRGQADPAEVAVLAGKVFSPEELKAARALLTAEGLAPIRLERSGSGQQILVAADRLPLCNALLSASTRRNEPGHDEFDKALDESPWMPRSDRQRQEQIDSARSRQVGRMLEQIPEVAEARVLFQRSKGRGFATDASMSATVSVKPREGRDLSPGLYRHVRRAVAGAWGMPESNVTVLNTATGVTVRESDDVAQLTTAQVPSPPNQAALPDGSTNSGDPPPRDSNRQRTVRDRFDLARMDHWAVPAGVTGTLGILGIVVLRRRSRTIESALLVEPAPPPSEVATDLPNEMPPAASPPPATPPAGTESNVGEPPLSAERLPRLDLFVEGESTETGDGKAPPESSPVPFGFLHSRGPDTILSFITDEHPQTIALIVSQLPAELAVRVLGGLPSTRRMEVVRRVAGIEQTSPEVIRDLEQSLSQRMLADRVRPLTRPGDALTGSNPPAEAGGTSQRVVLAQLERRHPELFDQIRRHMFSFEKLIELGEASLAGLMQHVNPDHWPLALMGAADDLKSRILKSLPISTAEQVVQEMQNLGPVRVSDVAASQQQIVDVLHRLEEQGLLDVGLRIPIPA